MSLADRLRSLSDALPEGGSVTLTRDALRELLAEAEAEPAVDLTARQAAHLLGVSEATVRRLLEARKFSLQAEVVAGWHELWRVDRSIEIDEQNLALLRQLAALTREQVAVGRAPQSDASKADLEVSAAENQLLTRRAERPAVLAALDALLSRPAGEPLRPAPVAPETRLPADAEVRLATLSELMRAA